MGNEKLNEIVMVKLINGEVVFGFLKELGVDEIYINSPTTLIQTQEGIRAVPWLPLKSDKETVSIKKNAIVLILGEDKFNDNLLADLKKHFFGIETAVSDLGNIVDLKNLKKDN